MFQDRLAAGEQLGARLAECDLGIGVVLGIPRGGLPVARPVADALDCPLDVVVASKIGAPHNAELALGAVAADGSAWYNDALIDRLEAEREYLDQEREHEADAAREKERRYRGAEGGVDLDGETVAVVDDGLATGATALACLRQVREAGAERVVFAVPVGSSNALARVEREADEVICPEVPERFGAVGQFYRSFEQVPDEKALEYLDRESAS
jgi:predicted phosphoribosyltransferase